MFLNSANTFTALKVTVLHSTSKCLTAHREMIKPLSELLGGQPNGHAASSAPTLKYIPFYHQQKPVRIYFRSAGKICLFSSLFL